MIPELLIVVQLAASPAQAAAADCTEDEIRSLDFAARLLFRGDDLMFRQAVEKGVRGPADRCLLLKVQRSSVLGWVEARGLAAKGGAAELQGPARQSLEELEQLKGAALDIEIEYAQTAIRAAIAAAQDERPEMELLLAHARDLAERLIARGRRAMWPRPFNLLAGELWFEVDRYEESRAAFERAAKADGAAVALVGLARALSRLGRREEACDTYRRVRDAPTSLREQARQDLVGCP